MKQIYRSTRAILTLLFLSFCALGGVNAQDVTKTVTQTSFSAISGDVAGDANVYYEAAKGGGTSNPAVNGNQIRIYQGGNSGNPKGGTLTITARNDNKLQSVTIGSDMATQVSYAVDGGDESSVMSIVKGGTLNIDCGGATSVTVTCRGNGTGARLYLNYLSVTYGTTGGIMYPDFAFDVNTPTSVQLSDGKVEVNVVASSTQSKGAVTYSLKDNPSGASITNEGLFTATAAGTYTIVAQLAADEENNYAASTIEHEISVLPESVAGVGFSFIETFDGCDGTTGEFSGSAGSKPFKPEMADNEGWVFSSVYAADKAVKLGTGSAKGSATTPTLAFTGDAVLTFTAAAWNNSSEKTTLNISISDGTLSQSSVTLEKAKYNTYTINITGVTQPVTITIEANVASNNRFFLDYVSVVQESAAGETLRDGLTAGKFGTICVNRTIEVSETEGATFYTVAGAHFNGSNPDYIVLEEAETLEAGRGYIFEATAEAITTTNAEAATATEGTNDGVIYGSLVDCKVPAGYYVVSDNVLRKSNGESTIKAGRAYIDVAAAKSMTDAEAAAPSYRRLGFDGTLTGIAAVGQATDEAAVYDLSGRLVRKAAKGVYVVNGKKVLVK